MPPKKRFTGSAQKKNAPVLPSVRLYRRIAGIFLGVTAVLLVVVLYLATVQATVRVWTEDEAVERTFVARVAREPQGGEDIAGAILTATKEGTRVFEVEGEGEEIPAKAHGTVTLNNESGTPQALVATTRLLSPEGVLFRLVSGVTVPANGTVTAEAQADQPGKEGEVAPTRFTVPGLNPTRQTQVYATSEQAMVGGTSVRKAITIEDLDAAQAALVEELKTEADEEWRAQISGQLDGATIMEEVVEKRSDTEPGTEAGSFTITTIVRFTGIYYDRARLLSIAELKLREHVPEGQVLTGINTDAMVVAYNRHDEAAGTAHFDVTVSGTAVLQATADVLNKENLVGLTAGEAEMFLENNDTIRDASVELKPFWVRKIPRLQDHITIEIVEG